VSETPIAMLTGASSGLGAEYARQLASRGYNLILVARRRERMQALAEEITARYPVQIELLPADLADSADIEKVECRVKELPALNLLVNNAGFGTQGRYYRVSPEKSNAMVTVHFQVAQRLARAALPAMVVQKHGAIINVASLAAFFPLPGGVIYVATKAALVAYSETLGMELKDSGVHVQVLCPGFTYTEFHSTSEYQDFRHSKIPRFMWGQSEPVVRESLTALQRNQVICIPGRINKLLAFIGRSQLARPLVRGVILQFYRRRR